VIRTREPFRPSGFGLTKVKNMNTLEFMRDMASRALRLSRSTLDLHTSRELRIMGEELKAKSEECAREHDAAADKPGSVRS